MPAEPALCPSCSAPLKENAVLCVTCGFHLIEQRHLATAVERQALQPQLPSDNPYESPRAINEAEEPVDSSDLPRDVVLKVERLNRDADLTLVVLLLSICCFAPIGPLLTLVCCYRLWGWYSLNRQHPLLHTPNSLSPHCKLVMNFRRAHVKLWVATLLWPGFTGMVLLINVFNVWR